MDDASFIREGGGEGLLSMYEGVGATVGVGGAHGFSLILLARAGRGKFHELS